MARKNPSTSTLLLLAGGGAAGYFLWAKPKIEAMEAARAAAFAAQGLPPPPRNWLGDILGVTLSVVEQRQKAAAEAAAKKKSEDAIRAILGGKAPASTQTPPFTPSMLEGNYERR